MSGKETQTTGQGKRIPIMQNCLLGDYGVNHAACLVVMVGEELESEPNEGAPVSSAPLFASVDSGRGYHFAWLLQGLEKAVLNPKTLQL